MSDEPAPTFEPAPHPWNEPTAGRFLRLGALITALIECEMNEDPALRWQDVLMALAQCNLEAHRVWFEEIHDART